MLNKHFLRKFQVWNLQKLLKWRHQKRKQEGGVRGGGVSMTGRSISSAPFCQEDALRHYFLSPKRDAKVTLFRDKNTQGFWSWDSESLDYLNSYLVPRLLCFVYNYTLQYFTFNFDVFRLTTFIYCYLCCYGIFWCFWR